MSGNPCIHELDCVNFGAFDVCIRDVTQPICCCHFLHVPVSLSNVRSSALIAELERREGVKSINVDKDFGAEIHANYGYVPDQDGALSLEVHPHIIAAPAKILVVREDGE